MLSKLSNFPPLRALAAATALGLFPAAGAFAQVTPAKAHTPPDDTPSFKVGTTIFTNFTYQDEPTSKDSDGNTIHPNSFEVSRAYINVTGNLSHLISWRVTPDIAGRFGTSATSTVSGGLPGETVTTKASTNYDGNLVFRLKYAFGQLNLDDWLPKGSWIRIGQQHTPYIDFYEHIYEYRFQGSIYPERQGYITSSDVGLASHISFPNNYGDVHLGIYNGDGYSKAEANDQKALQARVSLRPIPKDSVFKGLRVTGFFDADHAVKSASRSRYIGTLTYEHDYVSFGADLLSTKDQSSATAPEVKGSGYSFWVEPKTKTGVRFLVRYDNTKPNKSVDARQKRLIGGIAYWFHLQKGHAALFANYEKVDYDSLLNKPTEKRFALSCLFEL
jgi:hypothetical protein